MTLSKIQCAGLMVLLLTAGCSRKAVTSVTEETEIIDSTYIDFISRDAEVSIPRDSVVIWKFIECDSETNKPKNFKIEKTSKRSKVKVSVNDGLLVAVSDCDSLKAVISAMDKIIFRLRHETKKIKKSEPVYVTRRIDIICRWISGILVLLIIGRFALKRFKIF